MTFAFKFGTAGIRARAGEGTSELNLRSVRRIAAAIARGLAAAAPDGPRALCVGYDGRRDSRAFADHVCAEALAHGFQVYCFETCCPTPLLAFSVRTRAALGGVMITASHNPPEDNGIKLYLTGGRQIAAPLDRNIEAYIAAEQYLVEPPPLDLAQARAEGRLLALGEQEQSAYLDELCNLVAIRADLPLPRLAYSALCGVGTPVARALLARLGAEHVAEVSQQALPRADFGGLVSPNPEEPSALVLLRQLAQQEGSALAFAHDPDADRLAVLAREHDASLRSLSGDEVGALIGDFLLSLEADPTHCLLVSTLVSGALLERICAGYGAHYLRTPTGFKWIAKRGRERAEREQLRLLFGYEEALGYAFFDKADDKDGSAALYVLCELARRLGARGASLTSRLVELAQQHGAFVTRQISVAAKGSDGPARIAAIMQRLRSLDPHALLGSSGELDDHELGPEPVPLLVLRDTEGTRICVRPSGTEPKLKLYLHACEPVASEGDPAQAVATARLAAAARLDQLELTLRPLLQA
jgi:phosphomannomutase